MSESEILALLDDRMTLALTLYGEGRGEEVEGRIGIACVVRNRLKDDRWPDAVKDVCLQRAQFSCWSTAGGAPNYKAVLTAATQWLTTGSPPDVILAESAWVADGVISGVTRDRTSGSNHYITRRLWETARPSWLKTATPNCLLQRHAFFKL